MSGSGVGSRGDNSAATPSPPERWAMNDRQRAAILALRSEYPWPMVVGWAAQPGGEVRGHIMRDVEHDAELAELAADGKPWESRALGVFTVCTTGIVRWIGAKP